MNTQLSEYDSFMQREEDRTPDFFITVNTTPAYSGYFATLWGCEKKDKDELDEEFREPYTTGIGRFSKREDAVVEAKEWAECEEVPYIEEALSLKLYRLSQEVNNGYDSYRSLVVVAESADKAEYISPGYYPNEPWDGTQDEDECWCSVEDVKVQYLGEADQHMKAGQVICSSFNAG